MDPQATQIVNEMVGDPGDVAKLVRRSMPELFLEKFVHFHFDQQGGIVAAAVSASADASDAWLGRIDWGYTHKKGDEKEFWLDYELMLDEYLNTEDWDAKSGKRWIRATRSDTRQHYPTLETAKRGLFKEPMVLRRLQRLTPGHQISMEALESIVDKYLNARESLGRVCTKLEEMGWVVERQGFHSEWRAYAFGRKPETAEEAITAVQDAAMMACAFVSEIKAARTCPTAPWQVDFTLHEAEEVEDEPEPDPEEVRQLTYRVMPGLETSAFVRRIHHGIRKHLPQLVSTTGYIPSMRSIEIDRYGLKLCLGINMAGNIWKGIPETLTPPEVVQLIQKALNELDVRVLPVRYQNKGIVPDGHIGVDWMSPSKLGLIVYINVDGPEDLTKVEAARPGEPIIQWKVVESRKSYDDLERYKYKLKQSVTQVPGVLDHRRFAKMRQALEDAGMKVLSIMQFPRHGQAYGGDMVDVYVTLDLQNPNLPDYRVEMAVGDALSDADINRMSGVEVVPQRFKNPARRAVSFYLKSFGPSLSKSHVVNYVDVYEAEEDVSQAEVAALVKRSDKLEDWRTFKKFVEYMDANSNFTVITAQDIPHQASGDAWPPRPGEMTYLRLHIKLKHDVTHGKVEDVARSDIQDAVFRTGMKGASRISCFAGREYGAPGDVSVGFEVDRKVRSWYAFQYFAGREQPWVLSLAGKHHGGEFWVESFDEACQEAKDPKEFYQWASTKRWRVAKSPSRFVGPYVYRGYVGKPYEELEANEIYRCERPGKDLDPQETADYFNWLEATFMSSSTFKDTNTWLIAASLASKPLLWKNKKERAAKRAQRKAQKVPAQEQVEEAVGETTPEVPERDITPQELANAALLDLKLRKALKGAAVKLENAGVVGRIWAKPEYTSDFNTPYRFINFGLEFDKFPDEWHHGNYWHRVLGDYVSAELGLERPTLAFGYRDPTTKKHTSALTLEMRGKSYLVQPIIVNIGKPTQEAKETSHAELVTRALPDFRLRKHLDGIKKKLFAAGLQGYVWWRMDQYLEGSFFIKIGAYFTHIPGHLKTIDQWGRDLWRLELGDAIADEFRLTKPIDIRWGHSGFPQEGSIEAWSPAIHIKGRHPMSTDFELPITEAKDITPAELVRKAIPDFRATAVLRTLSKKFAADGLKGHVWWESVYSPREPVKNLVRFNAEFTGVLEASPPGSPKKGEDAWAEYFGNALVAALADPNMFCVTDATRDGWDWRVWSTAVDIGGASKVVRDQVVVPIGEAQEEEVSKEEVERLVIASNPDFRLARQMKAFARRLALLGCEGEVQLHVATGMSPQVLRKGDEERVSFVNLTVYTEFTKLPWEWNNSPTLREVYATLVEEYFSEEHTEVDITRMKRGPVSLGNKVAAYTHLDVPKLVRLPARSRIPIAEAEIDPKELYTKAMQGSVTGQKVAVSLLAKFLRDRGYDGHITCYGHKREDSVGRTFYAATFLLYKEGIDEAQAHIDINDALNQTHQSIHQHIPFDVRKVHGLYYQCNVYLQARGTMKPSDHFKVEV